MKKVLITLIAFLGMPLSILAYSNKVILGGENIGIHIDTKGILVIGFYQVNGKILKGNPEIMLGDEIIKVNDKYVNTIDELTTEIEKNIVNNEVNLTIKRNDTLLSTTLPLEQVDGVYKTGLYVKDNITGIGTLTYIDPTTKIYGALGHEVLESKTLKMVEVKSGSIFESNVTSIKKSTDGTAGEKNANFKFENTYGTINENTTNGIFGKWQKQIDSNTIEIAEPNEIKIGPAKIYTVLNGNEKKEYDINITSIQDYNDTKNMTFEIKDQELINKAGGIVQGMSGSPIVQNNKLIGAVTHVIVDHPTNGYAIFITTMLKKGDELNN